MSMRSLLLPNSRVFRPIIICPVGQDANSIESNLLPDRKGEMRNDQSVAALDNVSCFPEAA